MFISFTHFYRMLLVLMLPYNRCRQSFAYIFFVAMQRDKLENTAITMNIFLAHALFASMSATALY